MRKVSFPILLVLLLGTHLLFSQIVQVAFNKEKTIYKITKELASQLSLFTDVNNFVEAQLFQINDTTYNLEIYYKVDDNTLKSIRIISQKELEELQNNIETRLQTTSNIQGIELNQEGRTQLLVSSLVFSLIQAPLLTSALKINDARGASATILLYSAGGFFLPYFGTSNVNVPTSSATLHIAGSLFGLAQAYFLNVGFSNNWELSSFGEFTMLSLSLLGGWSGYAYAKNYDVPAGKADMMTYLGAIGFGYGLAVGDLVGLKNYDLFLSSSAGNILGIVAGNILANQQYYSRGDAAVVANTAILGAYYPIVICLISEVEESEIYSASGLLGSTLGIIAGTMLIKDKDFSYAQGIFIGLGTYAGMLLGSGLAYALSEDRKVILGSGAIGSLLGFTILYNSLKDDAKSVSPSKSHFDFQINPLGLLNSFDKTANSKSAIPILNFKYSF